MPTNPLLKAVRGGKEKSPLDPQECCDWANERISENATNMGLHWVVAGNKERPIALREREPVRLVEPRKSVMDRRGKPMSEEDTAELNHILENLGATARYRPDGSRYMVGAEA